MENVVFTQLSIPEVRQLLRQELESFFAKAMPIKDANKTEGDELCSIQQAAKITNLAVTTIYGLVARNEIPFMKRCGKLYFSRQELTDWIKSSRNKTISEVQSEAEAFLKTAQPIRRKKSVK